MSSWLDSLPPFLLALQTNNVVITETVLKVICEMLSQGTRHQMQTEMSLWLCEFIGELPCNTVLQLSQYFDVYDVDMYQK